jgi:DNA primase
MADRRGPIRKYPIAAILRSFGADVGDYRSGKQKIRCPFHDDSRPSAQVDFTNQRFRCWACGVSGDALDLLVTQEGLNLSAAIDRAEGLVGGADPAVREQRTETPALFGRPRAGGRRP